MSAPTTFQTHEIQLTIRLIQGYRYLDRCGEALIKLENTLKEGWIPTEPSPQAGSLKNDQLGMVTTFNSQALTVHQGEFVSFDHFKDQACLIYDILWQEFGVKRINVPVTKVVLQRGFEEHEIDKAAGYMLNLNLCKPHTELGSLMGGTPAALDVTFVSTEDLEWSDQLVHRRRRLKTSVVRQEKQPPFDSRMLARSRLLGSRQRDAIQALMRLKRQHPVLAPVAAQVDVEHSFETEFNASDFDLPAFLDESWQWAESVRLKLPGFERERA